MLGGELFCDRSELCVLLKKEFLRHLQGEFGRYVGLGKGKYSELPD